MQRTGSAHWSGGLKDGKGTVSTASGVLSKTQYSFNTRFENGAGTNPEELIAAAHAGCFSMAFSAELGKAGFTPQAIDTTATVSLDFVDGKPTITKIHLDMSASIPGIEEPKFNEIAVVAKKGCPVSRVLSAAEITLSAKLV